VLVGELLTNAAYERLLLVGADQESCAKSREAVLTSYLCCAFQSQAIADNTALTDSLVPDHGAKVRRHLVPFPPDHGQPHFLCVRAYAFTPPLMFGEWMDVGVIPEAAHRKALLTQALDGVGTAWPAADVQQQALAVAGLFLRADFWLWRQLHSIGELDGQGSLADEPCLAFGKQAARLLGRARRKPLTRCVEDDDP
jgi:hypothetical protein